MKAVNQGGADHSRKGLHPGGRRAPFGRRLLSPEGPWVVKNRGCGRCKDNLPKHNSVSPRASETGVPTHLHTHHPKPPVQWHISIVLGHRKSEMRLSGRCRGRSKLDAWPEFSNHSNARAPSHCHAHTSHEKI